MCCRVASVVSEVDQFEFLEDVIPQTMPLKAALERRREALDDAEYQGESNQLTKKSAGEQEGAADTESNGMAEDTQMADDDSALQNIDPSESTTTPAQESSDMMVES
jgi:hypothetical protein